MMDNFHCTVINVNSVGILIMGESGSGKSSLAMGLLEKAKHDGLSAILISDDQVLLEYDVEREKLIAHAPKPIAGKIEIYGFGITECEYNENSDVALVVQLVDQSDVPRMNDEKNIEIMGKKLPLILTPKQHEAQGVRIVLAWIVAYLTDHALT